MLTMPPIRSSSFRNRQNTIKMQSQTTEFAGCRYPTSQLLLLDRSPTATPVQTRSGSPTRADVLRHTVEEATEFMTKLNHIKKPAMSSEPVAAETHTGSKGPIALAEPDGKLVLKSVSATDGSAADSTCTKVKYLIVYFVFNLGLTLFNKAVMIAVCVCADGCFVCSLILFAAGLVEAGNMFLDIISCSCGHLARLMPSILLFSTPRLAFTSAHFNTGSPQCMEFIATDTIPNFFI